LSGRNSSSDILSHSVWAATTWVDRPTQCIVIHGARASSASSVESDAARFALLQAAKLWLEAEDDAQLVGLHTFPRSRYAPAAEALADSDDPIHNVRAITPQNVPGLPTRMYPMLASKFSLLTSRLVSHKTSADGSTTKLLIRLADGQHIESVIMRHKAGDVATGRVEQRITLCVSSQVGCAMQVSGRSTQILKQPRD